MAKKFKWVVEIEVDEVWVADGFDLSNEKAQETLLNGILQYAYSYEKSLKVLKAPKQKAILKAQGYTVEEINSMATV